MTWLLVGAVVLPYVWALVMGRAIGKRLRVMDEQIRRGQLIHRAAYYAAMAALHNSDEARAHWQRCHDELLRDMRMHGYDVGDTTDPTRRQP